MGFFGTAQMALSTGNFGYAAVLSFVAFQTCFKIGFACCFVSRSPIRRVLSDCFGVRIAASVQGEECCKCENCKRWFYL
jgi:hypothetical protein